MVIWKVEIDGATEIIRDIQGIDEALKNKTFTNTLWKNIFEQISVFIKKRFEEGKASSWKPLTPKYKKWKTMAVSKGYQVKVGSFGKRVCKLTDLGRLTNTMYTSATKRDKDANIFEINKIADGVQFRYAISGNKLPHALYFNNKREFFWITEEEAEEVFKIMEKAVEGNIKNL